MLGTYVVNVKVSNGGQWEDKKEILQHSQPCQHGEFQHVGISEQQRSRPCGQNLRGPFVRAVLAMKLKESAQAMAADGETSTGISTTKFSGFLHQNCMGAWDSA